MAFNRHHIRRLERVLPVQTTLVCPVCDRVFTVHGDVDIPVEFLVLDWTRGQEDSTESHRDTPQVIVDMYDHEHPASDFVVKGTGETYHDAYLGDDFISAIIAAQKEDNDES